MVGIARKIGFGGCRKFLFGFFKEKAVEVATVENILPVGERGLDLG